MAAYSRREILGRAFLLCKVVIFVGMPRAFGYEYIPGASALVKHPATTLKPADLERARQNIAQHEWAKQYAEVARSRAQSAAAKVRVTREWLVGMVPATTPGDTLFTPCPACRDQKKPMHPHGFWHWSPDKPDQLACKKCGMVFPFSALEAKPVVIETSTGNLKVSGLAARVTLRGGKVTGGSLIGGTSLKIGGFSITSPIAIHRGTVQGQKSARGDGYYEITGDLPAIPAAAHQTLFVDDGKQRRTFPILSTEKTLTGTRVHVKSAHAGYDPLPGKTWEVVSRVDVRQR